MNKLIDKLAEQHILSAEEIKDLIDSRTPDMAEYLYKKARKIREYYYGKDVYIRGLIEFSNYCKNDCLYCGIRKSNNCAERYRLTKEDILGCCEMGYALGFRTFVLQSGEDLYYTDDRMVDIISTIKQGYPDCAITLSIGEKSFDSYKRYRDAGADRYLLRHETADELHYGKLHPSFMSWKNRMQCLTDLKTLGYQVGCGFMVGSPYQTVDCLVKDLLFIKSLEPQMVGIGPFIPNKDTPFAHEATGSLDLTLFLLGLIRLLLPNVLLPATTALGTIHPQGRELGILAGANVVMPNLSPRDVRKKYMLYDNKICTGDEAAECRMCLQGRIEKVGYNIAVSRGDFINK